MCKLVSVIANVIDWMDGAGVKSYKRTIQGKEVKIIYNRDDDDYLLIVDDNSIFISEGMNEEYKRELIQEVVTMDRKVA